MSRKNGGIIGPANTPVGGLFTGVAGGVWRMNDVANFVSNSQWPTTPQSIDNSCRFERSTTDYLSKTFGSGGNRKTATQSFWFKRSLLSTNMMLGLTNYPGGSYYGIQALTDDVLDIYLYYSTSASAWQGRLKTNRKFRDISSYYHFVLAWDTTQSTSSDRLKLYVNGVQETSFSIATYPNQDQDLDWNNNIAHQIMSGGGGTFSGYLAEFVFIDGQQLTPSSFGETDSTTGIWKPKKINKIANAGTNSFYLDFKDSSNLGNDASGLNNDFAVTNLTSIDQTTDTCVENFANMSTLIPFNYNLTLSDGNLSATGSQNQWQGASSTMAINTGKWFYEAKFTSATDIINWGVGFMGMEDSVYTNATRNFVGFYNYDGGEIWVADSGHTPTTNDYGTFSNGDIIGIALDYDNEYISVYKNGSAIVTNFDYGAVGTSSYVKNGKFIAPKVFNYGSGAISLNFGNPPYSISSGNADANGFGNFEYAVPSGYYALNSSNLNTYG